MRYVLLRKKWLGPGYAGSANLAFTNQPLNIRSLLNCAQDEIAVCFDPWLTLTVAGGNADGDDSFSVTKRIRSAGGAGTVMLQPVWFETIAAASLLNGATFYRYFPGDNSETDMRSLPLVLNDNQDLFTTASAGGANVIYAIVFSGTWYVYKEIPEKYGEETPVPPPTEVPMRAGWWS